MSDWNTDTKLTVEALENALKNMRSVTEYTTVELTEFMLGLREYVHLPHKWPLTVADTKCLLTHD